MMYASTRSASAASLGHVQAGVNSERHGRRSRKRVRHPAGALIASVALLLPSGACSKELLVGSMPDGEGSVLEFRLDGESRHDVVGGRIVLGEIGYEISRVSRLGLIGARRFVGGKGEGGRRYAEFLVFSSSFSGQTAVGKPWLAAREAYGCDEPYNSFLALYRIEGEAAVKALGPIPYPGLAEGRSHSQHSRVSCFVARPPD